VLLAVKDFGCLDVASTHGPSTRSIFFKSLRSYRPAEGRVEAMRRQRLGPPPATTNRLLAEPGGGPWVNCAWVEVSRGRFVGGRIVKSKHRILSILSWGKLSAAQYKSVNSCHYSSLHSGLVCKISGGSWGSIRIIWASSLEDFPQSPHSLRLFYTKSVYVLKPSPTTRRTNAGCVSLLRYTASLGTVQYCTELGSVYSVKQLCNVQYLLIAVAILPFRFGNNGSLSSSTKPVTE
jgi:hypothetical protein